jgi:hypothetical protein
LAAAAEEDKPRGAVGGEEKTMPTNKENKHKEIKKQKKRMSKKKIVGIALVAIVGFFVILVVIGSTVPAGTVYKATSSEQITGVSQFVVLKDGSLYKARFGFIDRDERPVTSDANVTFAVKTQANNQTIYERAFNIKAEQFQQYQLVLTGAPILAYSWQIDSGEMTAAQWRPGTNTTTRNATAGGGTVTTPAFDSGMKTGVLTATLPNGKTFVAETTFF